MEKIDIRFVSMKPMHVLSSFIKNTNKTKCEDDDCIYHAEWLRITNGGLKLYPGEGFAVSTSGCNNMQIIRKIPDDCDNDTKYESFILEGFYIAAATQPPDYDVGKVWGAINKWLDESEYFELDAISTGGSRSEVYGTGFDAVSTTAGEINKIFGDSTVKEDFIKSFKNIPYPNQWECYVPIRAI